MPRRTLRRKNGGRKITGKRGRKVVPKRRTRKGGVSLEKVKALVAEKTKAAAEKAKDMVPEASVKTAIQRAKASAQEATESVKNKIKEASELGNKQALLLLIKTTLAKLGVNDNDNDNDQYKKLVNDAKTSLSALQQELEKPATSANAAASNRTTNRNQ